jgi:ADP-ribosylglycohydrolase
MDSSGSVDSPSLLERAQGCLLGGAVGDSLGAPVEFLSLEAIKRKYGPQGIQELDEAYGVLGAITDDTQMTLFTAEGLIRAMVRQTHKGTVDPPGVVAYAYQRWLHTQGEKCDKYAMEKGSRGWLVGVKGLRHRRAPGNTCLSALRAWNQDEAQNDSKGCGTVMRSAPFGFFEASGEMAFKSAAITHGHPEAKSSAAIFAEIIRFLVRGYDLNKAVNDASAWDMDSSLTSRLVVRSMQLAESDVAPEVAIKELGQGWVAEEALAIATYCTLKANGNFEIAVRLAVNHDGDSDSTGAIAGNIMGAAYGVQVIPERWLAAIELRDVIEQIATDMITEVPVAPYDGATEEEMKAERAFWDRYPGC